MQEGFPGGGLGVKGRVEVVEQAVAGVDCFFAGGRGQVPAVEFLVCGAEFCVVAVKGVESSQGGPSGAEFWPCVASEAADVAADHWHLCGSSSVFVSKVGIWYKRAYLEESGELEHLWDADFVPEPA